MKQLRNNIFIIASIILTANLLSAKSIHTTTEDELYIKTKHEHNHSCSAKIELSKKDIQRAARKRLWMLTQEGKISTSWLEVPIISSDKKVFTHDIEWVIVYQDFNIKDKKKQRVYIFVDLYGHVLGANYTGK